jgi:hypothetical protein
MQRTVCLHIFVLAVITIAGLSANAWATPYASAVRNTSGTTWEFVLNESADTVTINRDGGNAIVLNSPAKGRYTFDLAGFSTFDIQVAKDAPVGWTEISDRSNLFTHFFRPNSVVVNKDPSSPYFGTVYVSHPREFATNNLYGFGARTAGDGVIPMTADLIGVDFANNYGVVTDVNDVTQAKAPGWTVNESITASPWRLSLDDSGNVIASDWSNQSGGFKYASPDLSTGGLVLAIEDGVLPLLLDEATNTHEIHGSIVSKPIVSGTVGEDLTIRGIDEDFDLDYDTFTDPDGAGPIPAAQYFNSLWRWDVGAATAYDQPPVLEVSSVSLGATSAVPGAAETKWFSTVNGVQADAYYNPQYDKYYLTQSRTHGNESSLVIVSSDGVDGTTPTIEWSSRKWTLEAGLDGAVPTVNSTPEALAEIDTLPDKKFQDIFRSVGAITISADGNWMFAHRSQQFDDQSVDGDNPYLGASSDYPGSILVIPLDAEGLPIIDLDDNGTPGDTSDDFITNFQSITVEAQDGRNVRTVAELDAAGNLYTSSNLSELMQVFSPGGNTLAITTSDGTFSLVTPGGELVGDYNENDVVDYGDYTVWRNNLGLSTDLPNDPLGGIIDDRQFDQWKAAFGNVLGGGGGQIAGGTVPEPTTWLLLVLGAGCGAMSRRRR